MSCGIGASRPKQLFRLIATWKGPLLPHGLFGPGGGDGLPSTPTILHHRQQTGGGAIASIFATGDSIEVAPGDFRAITNLRFLDSGLSHSGEWVAFTTGFRGGAGVFRVNLGPQPLTPIPLPATGWALLAGLAALAALRRRA